MKKNIFIATLLLCASMFTTMSCLAEDDNKSIGAPFIEKNQNAEICKLFTEHFFSLYLDAQKGVVVDKNVKKMINEAKAKSIPNFGTESIVGPYIYEIYVLQTYFEKLNDKYKQKEMEDIYFKSCMQNRSIEYAYLDLEEQVPPQRWRW